MPCSRASTVKRKTETGPLYKYADRASSLQSPVSNNDGLKWNLKRGEHHRCAAVKPASTKENADSRAATADSSTAAAQTAARTVRRPSAAGAVAARSCPGSSPDHLRWRMRALSWSPDIIHEFPVLLEQVRMLTLSSQLGMCRALMQQQARHAQGHAFAEHAYSNKVRQW